MILQHGDPTQGGESQPQPPLVGTWAYEKRILRAHWAEFTAWAHAFRKAKP